MSKSKKKKEKYPSLLGLMFEVSARTLITVVIFFTIATKTSIGWGVGWGWNMWVVNLVRDCAYGRFSIYNVVLMFFFFIVIWWIIKPCVDFWVKAANAK